MNNHTISALISYIIVPSPSYDRLSFIYVNCVSLNFEQVK